LKPANRGRELIMDGNTPGGEWDKSKLPSRHVSLGNTSAPHRAFYYAMGMTE